MITDRSKNKRVQVAKRILMAVLLLIISFIAFVMIMNRNSANMTVKQKILKAVYPAFIWLQKKSGKEQIISAEKKTEPPVSFYSLSATEINGDAFNFINLKGKKVLLVNTTSNCGYTGQYEELEKLFSINKDKLLVIGFPSNDFKEQEKGDNGEIEKFCKLNFGITFPLMQKSRVKKGNLQNRVFAWLTNASQNGWNNKQPEWNFSKFLVDENGYLVKYFPPAVSPLSKEMANALAE